MNRDHDISASGTCPSGKIGHASRGGAKRQALRLRQMFGEHLRPYHCQTCDLWHVGHLPDDVRRGIRSADQHYQRAER